MNYILLKKKDWSSTNFPNSFRFLLFFYINQRRSLFYLQNCIIFKCKTFKIYTVYLWFMFSSDKGSNHKKLIRLGRFWLLDRNVGYHFFWLNYCLKTFTVMCCEEIFVPELVIYDVLFKIFLKTQQPNDYSFSKKLLCKGSVSWIATLRLQTPAVHRQENISMYTVQELFLSCFRVLLQGLEVGLLPWVREELVVDIQYMQTLYLAPTKLTSQDMWVGRIKMTTITAEKWVSYYFQFFRNCTFMLFSLFSIYSYFIFTSFILNLSKLDSCFSPFFFKFLHSLVFFFSWGICGLGTIWSAKDGVQTKQLIIIILQGCWKTSESSALTPTIDCRHSWMNVGK